MPSPLATGILGFPNKVFRRFSIAGKFGFAVLTWRPLSSFSDCHSMRSGGALVVRGVAPNFLASARKNSEKFFAPGGVGFGARQAAKNMTKTAVVKIIVRGIRSLVS